MLKRVALQSALWTLAALAQRLLGVVLLALVVARHAGPATSDRFFVGLGIVEALGAIMPTGMMAILTPRLVGGEPPEREAGWRTLGAMAAALWIGGPPAIAMLVLAWLPGGADVSPAAQVAFGVAGLATTAGAVAACAAQARQRAGYVVLSVLIGNVVSLALVAARPGPVPLAWTAGAVAAAGVVQFAVLTGLAWRAVPAEERTWLREGVRRPAWSPVPALLGAVVVAGVVQAVATLLVVLVRWLADVRPGDVTDVSLALRLALLPPGLLAYPMWISTAPLFAQPDLSPRERERLLADGLSHLMVVVGLSGAGLVAGAPQWVELFFGQGRLPLTQLQAIGQLLIAYVPLAVLVSAFVFLSGPYYAAREPRRLAERLLAGLALATAAALAVRGLAPEPGRGVAIAAAIAVGMGVTVWRVAAGVPGRPAIAPLLGSVVLATAGALVAGAAGRAVAATLTWQPAGSMDALGRTLGVGLAGAAVAGAVFVPIALAAAPPLRRLLRARWPFSRTMPDGSSAR